MKFSRGLKVTLWQGENMKNFDLIIIGGGAGAFAAAIRSDELKAKTVMINAGLPLGGTCVNVGCVPSKRLLRTAEIMHLAQDHGYPGLELDIKNFDFPAVVKDEIDLVSRMRQEKYSQVLRELESVSLIEGYAKFLSENEVSVNEEILRGGEIMTDQNEIQALFKAGYIASPESSNTKFADTISSQSSKKTNAQIDDLVCYCFKYSKKDIEQDFIENGRSLILEKITAEKKGGECDCKNKNPKGR